MLKPILLAALGLLLSAGLHAAPHPRVLIDTSLGPIEVELAEDQAPVTVDNFLAYVDAGFYDDTLFHRVIPGFMVQAGGLDTRMEPKPTRAAIHNEADNGLRNLRGSLAMARSSEPHSATAQFFINQQDNPLLDHGSRDFGYAVFGKVVRGMQVVDRISQVRTGPVKGFQDVPLQPVVIRSIRRM